MSRIIELQNGIYTKGIVNDITGHLLKKEIVIMPSDSIYGFLSFPELGDKIRFVKKRDEKPFIYLISDIKYLNKMGIEIKEYNYILEKYWPGSITFILKSNKYGNIGVRLPEWKTLQEIIKRTGTHLISTSVNYSGEEPLNDPFVIMQQFNDKADLIVVDKDFTAKEASTIVDLTEKPYKILRQGSVVFDEL